MENFALLVDFQVRPESLARFNELLAVNAQASMAQEPGCLQFDVLYDKDDPCHIVLYEIYESAAAFATHLTEAHTKLFLAAAKELVIRQGTQSFLRSLAPIKDAKMPVASTTSA